jgi:thiamine biosynthesis lipoprotein
MGTTWTIILYGGDERESAAALSLAFDELGRIEGFLSIHRPESELSRVNSLASSTSVALSPELLELLVRCGHYFQMSEGAFDITVGPLMEAWSLRRGGGRSPAREDLADAVSRTGFKHLHLDPFRRSVRFGRPGMQIDPGGIGKGYAADRLAEQLIAAGFDVALIAASRSTILGLGSPPRSRAGWPVDIMHPTARSRAIAEASLRDRALSTSGSLEKGFWSGGRCYSHLIDPRTGEPATGSLQVSVLAPRAIDSEVWTKPCLIHGREWAARHLPAGVHALFCEAGEDGPCDWIPFPPGSVDGPKLKT